MDRRFFFDSGVDEIGPTLLLLRQQGIAGVSHHSLLFSKTAVLPSLSEHDALDSKAPTMPMMARQYNKASSLDYVANAASHAFKPKDFTPRAYSASNTNSESPEEIKAKSTGCRKPFRTRTFESSLLFSLPEQGFDVSLAQKKAIARRAWTATCHAFQAKGRIHSKNMLCDQPKFSEPRGNQGKNQPAVTNLRSSPLCFLSCACVPTAIEPW